MKQAEIAKVIGYVQQYQNSSFAHSVFDYVLMGRASNISLFQKPSEADHFVDKSVEKHVESPIFDFCAFLCTF